VGPLKDSEKKIGTVIKALPAKRNQGGTGKHASLSKKKRKGRGLVHPPSPRWQEKRGRGKRRTGGNHCTGSDKNNTGLHDLCDKIYAT